MPIDKINVADDLHESSNNLADKVLEIIKVLSDVRALLLQIGLATTPEGKKQLSQELKAMLHTLPVPSL